MIVLPLAPHEYSTRGTSYSYLGFNFFFLSCTDRWQRFILTPLAGCSVSRLFLCQSGDMSVCVCVCVCVCFPGHRLRATAFLTDPPPLAQVSSLELITHRIHTFFFSSSRTKCEFCSRMPEKYAYRPASTHQGAYMSHSHTHSLTHSLTHTHLLHRSHALIHPVARSHPLTHI